MFFHILILPAGSTDSAGLTYGYYKTLPAAKESLMNWARGVLALHPDKRYSEIPADPRSTEKILLRVAIAAPGKKPAYEGIIVEHAFADEDGASFDDRLNRICAEARDAACEALAPGETVKMPYDEYDVDGNNISVHLEGRHGAVYADVKSVTKDANGKVTVTAVNEYSFEEKLLDDYWPYLADCILEKKNPKINATQYGNHPFQDPGQEPDA